MILGLALMGNSDQASAARAPTTKGVVAIAFVSSFDNSPSAGSFQRINLNVVSVRLNPSTDPNVSEFDRRWVTVGVPAGVGRSIGIGEVSTGSNFGGSFISSNRTIAIGEGRSEVQIDLRAIQGMAQIFNAQVVTAQTYNQAELVLDSTTPGNVVPLCASGFPAGEGCIDYKGKFPVVTPSPAIPMSIRATIPGGFDVAKTQVIPLVIKVDPGIGAPPTTFNQTIQLNPTISIISNTTSVAPFMNPSLGSIQGTITTNAAGGFSTSRPQMITALVAGTDNVVEVQTLPTTCNKRKTCPFILYLPAADASIGGTDYDIVASARSTSYAVRSRVHIAAGINNTDLLTTPLAVLAKSTVRLKGKVADLCTGTGVQATTLDLLVPDATISPLPDCTANPPTGCVVAASASSDEAGGYPLPGNGLNTGPFNQVPIPAASPAASYELVATAAGFDRTLVGVTANGGALACNPLLKKGTCNINLSHGLMTGNVTLGSGTGPVSVLIAAEDSGTNNIENLQMVTIPFGANSAPFTMNVPDVANIGAGGGAITSLDLFASTQDLFNGAPQAATGHTIAVDAGVSAPPAPSGGPPPVCATVAAPDLAGMTCIGHGSADGTVVNPGSTDTVTLSKDGVQIETVPVVPQASLNAGDYFLCAPADSYVLTHYQQALPTPQAVASIAVTLNAPVMVPTPAPSPGFTPTPCPGICQVNPPNANTGCLTCTATSVSGP